MPDVRWRGMEHQTLYDWINSGPGSTASTPQLDYWGGLRQSLADISAKLNSTLGDIGATWEGAAGASATAGLTPLQLWAEEAQSSAEVMSSSAQDQADHVATARAAMPEPQKVPTAAPTAWQLQEAADAAKHGKKGPAQAVAQQAADHEAQETAASDAHERAIQVMSNYQANSENNAATLGVFGTPPDLIVAVEMPDGSDSVTAGYAGLTPMSHHSGDQGPAYHRGTELSVNPAAATGHPTPLQTHPSSMPAGAPVGATGTVSPMAGLSGAAAAVGGVGALAGFAPPSLLSGSGAMMGAMGSRNRGQDQNRAANRPVPSTAPSMNQPAVRMPGEPGMPPPPPGAGGVPGGGIGAQETVRGGNPYLSVNPTTGNAPGDNLRRAPGAVTGVSGSLAAHGGGGLPEFGPTGGQGGGQHLPQNQLAQHQLAQQQMSPQQSQFGGPAGHGGAPMAPNAGQPANGHAQDDNYEGSSYLVETDSVFDDARMVAPPVLGGED